MTADIRSTMATLMAHAAPHVPAEALDDMTGLAEEARVLASNASKVCEQLGGLLAHDGAIGRAGSGYLQDGESVAALLFVLSKVFDAVGGMAEVGGLARGRCGGAA